MEQRSYINRGHIADPISILIVGDESAQSTNLRQKLEKKGHRVSTINACGSLLGTAGQSYYELIVLDDDHPAVGHTVTCHELKAYPELADLPVIVLTSQTQPDSEQCKSSLHPIYYVPRDATGLLQLIDQMQYLNYRYM